MTRAFLSHLQEPLLQLLRQNRFAEACLFLHLEPHRMQHQTLILLSYLRLAVDAVSQCQPLSRHLQNCGLILSPQSEQRTRRSSPNPTQTELNSYQQRYPPHSRMMGRGGQVPTLLALHPLMLPSHPAQIPAYLHIHIQHLRALIPMALVRFCKPLMVNQVISFMADLLSKASCPRMLSTATKIQPRRDTPKARWCLLPRGFHYHMGHMVPMPMAAILLGFITS